MLTFLGKVRKSLIESGGTKKPASPAGRYFLYAIGEILLVMIGILLALQVNNWNEARKQRKEERKLLLEFKRNFAYDRDEMQSFSRSLETRMKRALTLSEHAEQDLPYHDSLDRNFSTLSYGFGLRLASSAFKSLESRGVEIIRNDSLNSLILDLYTSAYPVIESRIDNANQNIIQYARPIARTKTIRNREGVRKPIDYTSLARDVVYRNTLLVQENNMRGILSRMEEAQDRISIIVDLINQELKE